MNTNYFQFLNIKHNIVGIHNYVYVLHSNYHRVNVLQSKIKLFILKHEQTFLMVPNHNKT